MIMHHERTYSYRCHQCFLPYRCQHHLLNTCCTLPAEYTLRVTCCVHTLRNASTLTRNNTALEEIRTRVQQKLQQQEQQLREHNTKTVTYRAVVRDAAGHEQSFEFKHPVRFKS